MTRMHYSWYVTLNQSEDMSHSDNILYIINHQLTNTVWDEVFYYSEFLMWHVVSDITMSLNETEEFLTLLTSQTLITLQYCVFSGHVVMAIVGELFKSKSFISIIRFYTFCIMININVYISYHLQMEICIFF